MYKLSEMRKNDTSEKLEIFKKTLRRQHYSIVGNHSAVKVCEWTKKSIKNEGVCYKEKFYYKHYGIRSHTCLQMSPAAFFCPNRCVYCWRAIEQTIASEMSKFEKVDEPAEIIDGCIEAHRKLLSGLKGYEGTDMKKWMEAQNPKNAAISLIGEPAAYPLTSELLEEFHRRGFTTFLVTNGQFPERLEMLDEKPTQLYLSLDAPNKEIYKRVDCPTLPDFWERIMKSVEILSSYEGRKCVRLTMIKPYNTRNWEEYAKLIEKINPHFVEVKAYMFLGFSRYRLKEDNMPYHHEIIEYASQLNEYLNYTWAGEDERSRVVLLSRV